jgi:hypothetical protein
MFDRKQEIQAGDGAILLKDISNSTVNITTSDKLFPQSLTPNIPPSVGECPLHVFIGRVDELKSLEATLSSGQTVVLEGMAGVGKSYLIDHFALTHPEFHYNVLILPLHSMKPTGEDETQILLDDLRERLRLAQPLRPEAVRQQALQTKVLLHLENADSDAALVVAQRLLSYLRDCPVLISGTADAFETRHRLETSRH